MDYFIAVREGAGGDAGVHERTGDGAEVYEGTADAIWILDYYYYMQEDWLAVGMLRGLCVQRRR